MHQTKSLRTISSTTQAEAVINFIRKMDIKMIDAFLDDNNTYQDFEKHIFINKLQITFETFKAFGDTELSCHEGECNNCNKGCKGFSFIGNNSKNYMDVIVETKRGKINDLYECVNFKNVDITLIKNQFIPIDKIEPWHPDLP